MITFKILDPVHVETNQKGKVNLNACLSYEDCTWTRPRAKNKKKRRIAYPVYLIQPTYGDQWVFPAGLLPKAVNFLEELNIPYQISGTMGAIEYDKPGIKGVTFRPDQKRLIKAALTHGRGVLQAVTGSGKCHGKNTPIIMYDGSMKMVQDIQAGDLLMGPDSKPRKVLNTTTGYGPMYQVTPVKGTPFTCNGDHILSLKSTATIGKGETYKKDRITNISIDEYLKKSRTFKHMMKLWRTGVEFPKKKVPVDPYMVGIYLGDGHRTRNAAITTGNQDPEVGQYIESWAKQHGLDTRKQSENNCVSRFIINRNGINNWFRRFVKELVNSKGERTIPKEYLINSRENRLRLLAGLIDTDGHYSRNAVYDLVFKDKRFVKQIAFLARSLGFAANISKKIGAIKSRNFKGVYWRLCISGNLDKIPCKVARKKATPRKQIKNHLRTGFSIKAIGDGKYYGFTLSKDGLYLLGDFTVTHNTVVLIGIISAFKQERILFLCHTLTLVSQFKEELVKWGFKDIGVLSGNERTTGRIQLATIQSFSRLDPKTYVDKYDVILVDECFYKDTRIRTKEGPKPIKSVLVGDTVHTSKGPKRVTATFKTKVKLKDLVVVTLSSGKKIYCSKDHLFKVSGGWTKACDLAGKLLVPYRSTK